MELQFIASEILQAIYAEIENLPTQCREVVRLAILEGKTNDEIAEAMNIAYKSVQNNKTRGMQMLRTALLKNPHLGAVLLFGYEWLLIANSKVS